MDSKKKSEILKLCRKIESKYGEGSIYSLGSGKAVMKIPRISTCIEDLDHILGGGIPKGRIIEVYGAESSGKTSLGLYLCSLCEMALYIAAEGTFDAERAKIFGNRPKQLLVYRPKYGEDALDRVMEFTKAGIPLIVVDSVPALMPREDYEKVEKSLENEHRIGGVARLLNKTLPVLERESEASGTAILFINQVRDKMNAMLFGDKTDTPGGKALKFYASVRMQVGRRAWIEVPNKDPKNSAANEKVGMITKFKVTKSKVCNPFGECEVPMIFDRGYVSHDDVLKIRKEIMAFNRKKQKEGKYLNDEE